MFERRVLVRIDENGRYLPEDINRAIGVRRAVKSVSYPDGPKGRVMVNFDLTSEKTPKNFNWIEALSKLSL